MPRQAKTIPTLAQTVQQALAFHRQGRLAEAERLYRAALAQQPRQFEALHFLGLLRLQQGDAGEALELLRAAAKIRPGAAEVLPSLGAALTALGRHEEALAVYDGILRAKPDDADAGYNRGVVLSHLGRHAEALASYDKVLAIRPGHVPALFNRGNVLAMFERFEQALASYDNAIALAPRHIDALNNRASALKALKRYDEAIAAYDRVLGIVPKHADALNNRGNTLFELNRYTDAIADLQAAAAINRDDYEIQFNLGRALQENDRDADALVAFDRALATRPQDANALYSRGNSFAKLNRISEATADYEGALRVELGHPHAFGALLRARCGVCDWSGTAGLVRDLANRLSDEKSIIEPFQLFCLPTSPADQLNCARKYIRNRTGHVQPMVRRPLARDRNKIRIAYCSADFRDHVVATVIAQLFELHDRRQFEVWGISFGPDDNSALRQRLMKAFDRFHDVRFEADRKVAELLRSAEIDIAIDLMGHTQGARPGIFAHRAVPIQASYLGYPGTIGAEFIDYIIADPRVLPIEEQPFYVEKIVHLPDTYQITDSGRNVSARIPSRSEIGLPEGAFVFCCFNSSYKISEPMFETWMRLLRSIEGSVLWLAVSNEMARENLRREAERRGIGSERLVLTGRVNHEDYLVRHALADLFLDTLPYNAHGTGSNALGAGLPVLTCRGETFPGRVGASMLHAVGLPELVTDNLEEYEALAVKLATDRELLGSVRRKLDVRRHTSPLFDADRLRRDIEAAYLRMLETCRRGEPPRHFRIEPASADRE